MSFSQGGTIRYVPLKLKMKSARLSAFESIKFGDISNTIDAAIALLDSNDLGYETPTNGYGAPSSIPRDASVNLAVKKYGRMTSLTHGIVSAVNGTVTVSYSSGTALFTNQVFVTANKGAFIKAGDSGSLLVTEEENHPVGLLFAGNGSGRFAIANPISAVLERFNVSIDDGS